MIVDAAPAHRGNAVDAPAGCCENAITATAKRISKRTAPSPSFNRFMV